MLVPAALSVGEQKKRITPLTSLHGVISPSRALRDVGSKVNTQRLLSFIVIQSISESFNFNTRIIKLYHFQNGDFPNLYKMDRGICNPIH